MQKSPSWEGNSYSADHETLHLLCLQKSATGLCPEPAEANRHSESKVKFACWLIKDAMETYKGSEDKASHILALTVHGDE
jgi:hypothetical protein